MTDTEQSSEDFHWTYAVPVDKDLQQGDIIDASEELRDVFAKILPHFAKPAYQGFMVLTQSCDLVRRRNRSECKAPYISLACIRRLEDVLGRLLSQDGISPFANTESVFDAKSRDRASKLLDRLFNQNEQGLGLFYLHPDARVNIDEASVVFLRVTLSLQRKHYNLLVKHRVGTLSREFRPKLGWLTGNLYSRVGTTDWGTSDLKRMVDDYLPAPNEDRGELQPVFLSKKALTTALNCKPGEIGQFNRAEMLEAVRAHEIRSPRDIAFDRIDRVLREVFCDADEGQISKVVRKLKSDQELCNTIRDR